MTVLVAVARISLELALRTLGEVDCIYALKRSISRRSGTWRIQASASWSSVWMVSRTLEGMIVPLYSSVKYAIIDR